MATTPADLAATLTRRHKRAHDGARARAVLVREAVDKVVEEQGRAGRFRRAFLVGSLAHGTFGAGSDVDIVVEGLSPDNLGLVYDALVGATRTEVDVLRLEELPLAFRARVEAEGIVLYGA